MVEEEDGVAIGTQFVSDFNFLWMLIEDVFAIGAQCSVILGGAL